MQASNLYLDYIIDPSFQAVNRLFVLSFEKATDRTVRTKYYLPTVEIKDNTTNLIQQINFTENLNRSQDVNDNTTMFFIIEEANKTILDFSQGTVRVL